MKSIKFVFSKAIIIVFFIFCAGSSYSQNSSESYVKTDANKVQFMGMENNFLVFDLFFMEVPAKGCTLKIMDNDGNVMFEESISGNSYTRRYKVAKEETSRISFKALGKGFVYNQTFVIKKEEKLVVTSE